MAYFNHAFQKLFLATGATQTAVPVRDLDGSTINVTTDGALVITPGVHSLGLNQLSKVRKDGGNALTSGYVGIFDAKTHRTFTPDDCCPAYIAGSAIYANDKIGSFHGGYQETNKSKIVNPKYVSRLYSQPACSASNEVLHIGATPYTDAEAIAGCQKEFLCDETYSLRIDIKGSPALRFLNRNTYLTVEAYTGCCPDDAVAPEAVDGTLVYIEWAKQIISSQLIAPFLKLVVIAEDGTVLYDPTTNPNDLPGGAVTWDQYVSPGHTPGSFAGMILEGAYVDTKFGDCTFQTTDFFEKEPVKIYASLVDMNGDPCTFDNVCTAYECQAKQAEGFGEQVMRNLVLSESYRQNFFHSDLRIREITQGNQMLEDIDRSAQYDRLYLLHSVPRFNNPTSTFDNDRYLLEFVGLAGTGSLTQLTTTLSTWLNDCGVCEIEINQCTEPCEPGTEIPDADFHLRQSGFNNDPIVPTV